MRRARRVSAERIGFGRGTNNEVPLKDLRVALSAASLFLGESGLVVESLGLSPLQLNGHSAQTAPVKPGDEILIGPYRILMTDPPEGCDAALSFELVQPMGDALGNLVSGSRVGLQSAAPSKRAMAWTAFIVVIAIALIAPIVIYAAGLVPSWREGKPRPGAAGVVALSWNAGQLSNPHRPFATDCKACHQASFTAVADNACLACHANVGSHAEKTADLGPMRATLDARGCTHCHEEHRGLRGLVIREQSLCLDCHRNLAATAPKSGLASVTGFPSGHPQFRATLVADPLAKTLARQEIGANPAPTDHPGLHFSHQVHLRKGGYPTLGPVIGKELACADCHKPEPSGQGFMPITYAQQCQSCHALKFDRTALPWPDGVVPHHDDSGIVAAVWNYYAAKALQGETGAAAQPAPAVSRQAAGAAPATVPPPPPKDAQAWVAARAESALRDVILDDKRGCGYCHIGTGPKGAFQIDKIIPPPGAAPTTTVQIVAPVSMRIRFLPKARFDHAKHLASNCDDCHNARQSDTSADVLIPGKETCVRCHGGENAALSTQSTCVTCHAFHHTEFGPMRETAAALH